MHLLEIYSHIQYLRLGRISRQYIVTNFGACQGQNMFIR